MTAPAQTPAPARFDRRRLVPVADGLAVALVVSLPWSTSATAVLVVLWLVAALPTLDAADIRCELRTPAGGLPVLLWALCVFGMLWADVPWRERLDGLSGFHKLLVVPLLLAYFRRSGRGQAVMFGFLASCALLLAASWATAWAPSLTPAGKMPGVPVKDYISQNAMFVVCIFLLAWLAVDRWGRGRRLLACALALLAAAFLFNILSVAASRTALIVIPVLMAAFGFLLFRWRGVAILIAALVLALAAAWPQGAFLQHRVLSFFQEVSDYRSDAVPTPAGERLEFWRKSVRFVVAAPVIGHGTGAIEEQFRRAAEGGGVGALVTANPHQQTLAVAIQLGALGVVALWAMWIAHLLLFRGFNLVAWAGFVVVTQNVVGSLFNSHLFDFTHGWLYVVGVGVAGGLVMRERARQRIAADS